MKFNPLIPELSVRDLAISRRFYIDVLGFWAEYERVEDGFVFLSLGEAQIMLEKINGNWEIGELEYPFGRGINFQIECANVHLLRDRLVSCGFLLFRDIYEASYRQNEMEHKVKEFLVQDPDGYLLRFSQSV